MEKSNIKTTQSEAILPILANSNCKRRVTLKMPLNGNLLFRSESPRTKEAALQLGYNINDIQLKNIEDFDEKNVIEEVKKLRYDHYLNKTLTIIREINKRRKHLIRVQTLDNNSFQISNDNDKKYIKSIINSLPTNNFVKSKLRQIQNSTLKPEQMKCIIDKISCTLTNFKPHETFDNNNEESINNTYIQSNLDKTFINHQKMVKVRSQFLQNDLEEIDKKEMLFQSLKLKEKEIQSNQKKLKQKHDIQELERKKKAKLKFEHISKLQQKENEEKIQKKNLMNKKLQQIKERLNEEKKKKEEEIRLNTEMIMKKQKNAFSKRIETYQNNENSRRSLQLRFEQQMNQSVIRYNSMLQSKKQQIKQKIEKIEYQSIQAIEEKVEIQEQNMSKIINKIAEQEIVMKQKQQKKEMEEKLRKAEEKKKDKKRSELRQNLIKQQRERNNMLNQKFNKTVNNEKDSVQLVREEKVRLKFKDLNENYLRQLNVYSHKAKLVEDKHIHLSDNLKCMKMQKDLARLTVMERNNLDQRNLNQMEEQVMTRYSKGIIKFHTLPNI